MGVVRWWRTYRAFRRLKRVDRKICRKFGPVESWYSTLVESEKKMEEDWPTALWLYYALYERVEKILKEGA